MNVYFNFTLAHLRNIELKFILGNVGKSIARIHNADIIHGDLTTSNMMIRYYL